MSEKTIRTSAAKAFLIADRVERLRSQVRELGGDPLVVHRATAGKLSLADALEGEISRLEAGEPPLVFCLRPCCDFHPNGSHLT